jgi:hypothetical protein
VDLHRAKWVWIRCVRIDHPTLTGAVEYIRSHVRKVHGYEHSIPLYSNAIQIPACPGSRWFASQGSTHILHHRRKSLGALGHGVIRSSRGQEFQVERARCNTPPRLPESLVCADQEPAIHNQSNQRFLGEQRAIRE